MEQEDKIQEVISYTRNVKDSALVHLALCANLNAGLDITIIISGQVVAGQLISGKEYAETQAKSLRAANPEGTTGDVVASFYDALANEYRNEEGHEIPLNYLHIKTPSYMQGNGSWTTVNGTILRVPIEKVGGFSLGKDSRI